MNFKIKVYLEERYLITKILVAVDGSKYSEKAVDYALEIAEKFSASILLLNVFPPLIEYGYQPEMLSQGTASGFVQVPIGGQVNSASFLKELRKIHKAVLSKSYQRAVKLRPNLKITTQLIEGKVSTQIIETATDGEFDLIVMGHRGAGSISEVLLGSTSERVVQQASCSVLIVK